MARTLYLEHGLLRAAITGLLNASRPTWTPAQALDDLSEPLPYFDRIIGAGAGLTGTGRPALTAMLLLDALQPVGVVKLQTDSSALIPALGALARIKPEAVVQVLDESGLEDLCTCFNVSGTPRKGRPAVRVRVTNDHGETEKFTINGGELWVYPLSIGLKATLRISLARGLHVNGKRRIKLEVEGGLAGVIIDARGRPLSLATNLKALAAQIPEWYAQATGEPINEVPLEWMEPPSAVEPEITSVVKGRKPQRDRVLTVLGDDEEQPKQKSRGRMFGRNVKDANDREPAAVTEDDDDDLRNLLS